MVPACIEGVTKSLHTTLLYTRLNAETSTEFTPNRLRANFLNKLTPIDKIFVKLAASSHVTLFSIDKTDIKFVCNKTTLACHTLVAKYLRIFDFPAFNGYV